MKLAPHHTEIHHLVDRLTPSEAEALYVLLKSTVARRPDEPEPVRAPTTEPPVPRFSFTGIMHAGPYYAARSKQVIRDEFGRPESQ